MEQHGQGIPDAGLRAVGAERHDADGAGQGGGLGHVSFFALSSLSTPLNKVERR